MDKPPTAEQVAEEVQSILSEHRPDEMRSNFCTKCGQRWPCDNAETASMLAALQAERERLVERLKAPLPEEVAECVTKLRQWVYTRDRARGADMIERLARRNAELEAELRANGETALRAQAMEIDRLSGPTKRLPPPPQKENDNR